MSRSNKVKRYKNIYNDPKRKRKKILKVIVAISACALLMFVGYSAYQPLLSFINGEMTYDTSQDLPASTASTPISPTESASEDTSLATSSTTPAATSAMQGVFVPLTTVKDSVAFEAFLADAKIKGYTAVILEAKDNTGAVQYQSAVPAVAQASAQAADAYPLAERIQAVKTAGLKPVVRLVAFEDNTASRILEGSFIMYRGSTSRWLDNSADAGGRGWLSPESTTAQAYITALSEEIASMGCDTLLLASFQYPTGLGLNLSYGGEQSDISKIAVLQAYAITLTSALKVKNAVCYLETPAESILNGDDARYGGNPMDVGFKNIAPQIYPSSLTAPLTVGAETIPVPKDSPYEATKLVLKQIQTLSSGKVDQILPLLQSYDGYETANVQEQEKAVTEAGIKNYILYSPTGTYPGST